MKEFKGLWVLLLAVSVVISGCAKKSDQQTSIAGPGFDSSSSVPATTNEELAQLPQAGAVPQQSAVEALPVEASPVSQSAVTSAAPLDAAAAALPSGKLTHEQQIQAALKNLGLYNGKIDGKLGPASKRAVEAFQKQSGLKADGKVGPKTWAALSAHLNPDTASAAAASQPAETPVAQ